MLNRIILKGNLGCYPEIQVTQEGRKIAKFSLATSSTWKDKSGEWQTKTYWHNVIVYRSSTVRWMQDVLKKGDLVYVEGRLMYKQQKCKHGGFHWTTYVVVSEQDGCVQFLSSRDHLQKPTSLADVPESITPEIQESKDLPLENINPEDPKTINLIDPEETSLFDDSQLNQQQSEGEQS